MRRAILTRTETGDEGTFGRILTDTGWSCVTGELPWRDLGKKGVGDPDRSCIPPGKYLCKWRKSPRFGFCYHLFGVPGRSDILIHSGNFVGDKSKGLRADVRGCIVPGLAVRLLLGQRAVVSSRDALEALEQDLGREDFELTIEDETELIVPAKRAA